MRIRIGIIGDYDPNRTYHAATEDALQHAAAALTASVDIAWLPTPELEDTASEPRLLACDGLWCAPGSPYRSTEGALRGIRFARENGRPFIGT